MSLQNMPGATYKQWNKQNYASKHLSEFTTHRKIQSNPGNGIEWHVFREASLRNITLSFTKKDIRSSETL